MTKLRQLNDYRELNEPKADFSSIYSQADPREYYRVLYGLDYVIPDLAKVVFRRLADALEAQRGRPITVLDIGCSYGVNAALLRYPLDIDRLALRYRNLADAALNSREVKGLDCHYFQSWPKKQRTIIGLDASEPAISYAEEVGLIDAGLALNLEEQHLTEKAAAVLKSVDLIISTGCVGYVTSRTFDRVLCAIKGPRPWIASFVLRMFPYDPIAQLAAKHGLETEKLSGVTFVQRRFHSAGEYVHVLDSLDRQEIDTTGKEAEGLYHAEFFLSRPPDDLKTLPLSSIVSITSGANRSYGRRWTRGPDNELYMAL